MRKFSFYLMLVFIIASCDSKEELTSKSQLLNNPMQLYIINGDIEYYSEITDGSKPKPPIFVYDIPEKTEEVNNLTSKTEANSVTINFNYGITDYPNSGCTDERYDKYTGKNYTVGVYGPNPVNRDGFLVRGYGKPYHNFAYNTLFLQASNKGYTTLTTRGLLLNDNLSKTSAISIEYPFKANVSYDIEVKTYFRDNRYLIDNVHSSGFPSLYAHLRDTGIIAEGEAGCKDNLIPIVTEQNYIKPYTLDSPALITRNIIFKFSPLQAKNALIFALNPTQGGRGTDVKIPTNSYTMALYSVKITEKPFDPSLNISTPRPR